MMQKDVQLNVAEALLRVSNGDEVSFEAIYNNYGPGLYLKLIKILKSDFLAEDILQEPAGYMQNCHLPKINILKMIKSLFLKKNLLFYPRLLNCYRPNEN